MHSVHCMMGMALVSDDEASVQTKVERLFTVIIIMFIKTGSDKVIKTLCPL